MKIWRIKKGHDFRIRSRHPWVFSNELLDSPKGILAGEEIELQSMEGHFIARGYGNPSSLISFRAMSFLQREEFTMRPELLTDRLFSAWKYRDRMNFKKSFRLCYSEADQMPGLILDRYVFEKDSQTYQVFSYQLLTSGMDVAFKKDNQWQKILENLVAKSIEAGFQDISWQNTIVLQRNDVNIRKLEGLTVEEPLVLKTAGSESLTDINIQVQNVLNPDEVILFNVNLPEGQKTGFFLDQTFNIRLLLQHLESQKKQLKGKTLKILDLCCYMGQWSAQLTANLKTWGVNCEVHLVDVSELALEKARKNIEQFGFKVMTYKKDVLSLDEIVEFKDIKFDVVISDPPAFVKNKKDLNQGLAAYTKLNTQAFKLCANEAVIVSCTCSGSVSLEDFKQALRKAILKSGANVRCLAYGGQGWDHPHLMHFTEGYYLKMVMHQIG
ncbi:MAG: class I SAM-dependent rRNA methyltransferase [Pseudobdellovibrio sp.]